MDGMTAPPPPAPPPSGSNQRKHPRFELLASVELRRGAESLILPARNLSLGGVFLGSDGSDLSAFKLNETLEVLLFDAVDDTRPPVRATASVVRHDEGGMALRWQENPRTTQELTWLIDGLKSVAQEPAEKPPAPPRG